MSNTSYPKKITKGMITVPYRLLKEAVERIEKKTDVCHILPSARFEWTNARILDYSDTGREPYVQVGENMPSLSGINQSALIKFTTLVCDQLDGESTGCAAERCENCIKYNSYSKNHTSPTTKIKEGN